MHVRKNKDGRLNLRQRPKVCQALFEVSYGKTCMQHLHLTHGNLFENRSTQTRQTFSFSSEDSSVMLTS